MREWEKGEDWDNGSEGMGGVEVNPRISRPGFGAAGGVVQGADAGGRAGLRQRVVSWAQMCGL